MKHLKISELTASFSLPEGLPATNFPEGLLWGRDCAYPPGVLAFVQQEEYFFKVVVQNL
jgi:hypothetical protein